jgi:hypothetical protein
VLSEADAAIVTMPVTSLPCAGLVIATTGGVVSRTVTVKVPADALPALSAAVQETAVVPMANVLPEAGKQTTGTTPSIASSDDAAKVTVAPLAPVASAVTSAGRVSTGPIESRTITVKLPLDELPLLSVAEHDTGVAPIANVAPEAGVQLTGTMPSTASSADAVKVTTAPAGLVASTVRSPGSVKTGPVESCTVTMKLPPAVLPAASAAEQATVVAPIGKSVPDPGVQKTDTLPSTASVADAAKLTTEPAVDVASTVWLDGSVSVGAVVSCTEVVKLPAALLPAASVAEHETVVVPRAKVLPEAGVQLTGTMPSITSSADALNETIAPAALVASAV